MKSKIYKAIDDLHTKAFIFKNAHETLYRKHKSLRLTSKILTIILSSMIVVLIFGEDIALIHSVVVNKHLFRVIVTICALLLFILSIFNVAYKSDERIFVHSRATEEFTAFIKLLNERLKEVKNQDMSSYKKFMYEIIHRYHTINTELPSRYFLNVNTIFCKKFIELKKNQARQENNQTSIGTEKSLQRVKEPKSIKL